MYSSAAAQTVAEALSALSRSLPVGGPDFVDATALKREYPKRFGKIDFALPEFQQINDAAQWDYQRESWAHRFFDNWRTSLKWQRLKPYERFAEMIDRHWDGIAAYCKPENKVSLGFVEGLNNKIRVFQRRAYGLKDEEYLRLKVLSCMLPPI